MVRNGVKNSFHIFWVPDFAAQEKVIAFIERKSTPGAGLVLIEKEDGFYGRKLKKYYNHKI
jgi:hypothetical protein